MPNGHSTDVPFKAIVEGPSPTPDRDLVHRRDYEIERAPRTPLRREASASPDNSKVVSFSPDGPFPITTPARRNSTPTGRRSVQFARPAIAGDGTDARPDGGGGGEASDAEAPGKERRGVASIFSKLRGLTTTIYPPPPQHARSPSGYTLGGESIDERYAAFTPDTTDYRSTAYTDSPGGYSGEGDSDADSELSEGADDEERRQAARRSKRRKSRRPADGGIQTAPTTPKTPFMRDARPWMPTFYSQGSGTERHPRPTAIPRRATMSDIGADRQVVSEDEGRERLAEGSPWRRHHGLRALSHHVFSHNEPASGNSGDATRPSALRRALTGRGDAGRGDAGAADGAAPSPWKLRGERTASLSAAKWRQIKAGLQMLGRRRRAATRSADHAKSAELLAELSAAAPAALILASMFQRDEHGHRRIPVLLEQLKVHVADSSRSGAVAGAATTTAAATTAAANAATTADSAPGPGRPGGGDRHMLFRIELEYGSGPTRMKWVVHRTLRDFTNLHAKYKFQAAAQKYTTRRDNVDKARMPRFPRSAFPFLRGIRGTGISDSEDEEEGGRDKEAGGDKAGPSGDKSGPSGEQNGIGGERSGPSGEESGIDRARKRKSRPSLHPNRRKSSIVDGSMFTSDHTQAAVLARREQWPERQRRKLEQYLQQMIRWLMFRAGSNRLCKFLELSALGIRLSTEGSWHGKEGFLIMQSGKGVDFRHSWNPTVFTARHRPKWFLVRHSYIVCVDSPEEMNVYDVVLVDSDFRVQAKRVKVPLRDQNAKNIAKQAKESAQHPQHHKLKIYNSERKIRLLAKHERQLRQFEDSIQNMLSTTPWALKNRFDSFAPVRTNVAARFLVDGRDYMWNVSRAINMAKDTIYIHDWWLSPELYMRRPAAISKKWRLDRLLQRKAREGVRVFVIVYRNINSAIPIDSEYSKFSLLDLDRNVMVQRSPNQMRQGTFFWAHHEKICIVDQMIAFVGGIDLCFGRWDTPQHLVADDKLTGFEDSEVPKDADHCQLWPGKDYSNPRVQDFYALDKPYEEMYDRSRVPRMPWHDVAMQIVGQPARDLTRHFVQRWNFILRQRKPSRPTPFLLPPPDLSPADIEALGIEGTCEVQILRSCAMWSMGTPDRVEHSIMNAYVKTIEQSEHFVYIENQFFISSCDVEGTRIENHIGDALVERAVRAYQRDEDWRAVVVIPLMPGFQNTVDQQDGTSVRLIMQCQFRSISRGERSIFGRLRAEGIEPEDYIQFFGLRTWGQIGPGKSLVSEQLYIHAKCMVVDDRVAIIGSANINERSMLGSRDSETAAIVRDTAMVWSSMNGVPYRVGVFPHELRVRLMREHLGLDVDEPEPAAENGAWARSPAPTDNGAEDEGAEEGDGAEYRRRVRENIIARNEDFHSFNHVADYKQEHVPHFFGRKRVTTDPRIMKNKEHEKDVEGRGVDHMAADNPDIIQRQRNATIATSAPATTHEKSDPPRNEAVPEPALPPYPLTRTPSAHLNLPQPHQLPALPRTDDTDIGGPPALPPKPAAPQPPKHPLLAVPLAPLEPHCTRDPLRDAFYADIWQAAAEHNTALFRAVFRCMPDNAVTTWRAYKEYAVYAERFAQLQNAANPPAAPRAGGQAPPPPPPRDMQGTSGPPGAGSARSEAVKVLDAIKEAAASAEGRAEQLGEKIREGVASSGAGNGNGQPRHPADQANDYAGDAARRNEAAAARRGRPRASTEKRAPEAPVADEKSGGLPPVAENGAAVAATGDGQAESKGRTTPGAGASAASRRGRRRATRGKGDEFCASDEVMGREEALELLSRVRGHLVVWPHDWYVSPPNFWLVVCE